MSQFGKLEARLRYPVWCGPAFHGYIAAGRQLQDVTMQGVYWDQEPFEQVAAL